ncbi:MAG: HAD-IA family hydrolase [Pseudomonadota bacterium]
MARLIFDLDGTLLDSAPSLAAAGNRLLSDLGRPPVDVATYTRFVGRGMTAQVEQLLEATGGVPGALAPHLDRFLEHYNQDPVSRTVAFPGVVDALARLRLDNRIGVATQKPEAAARHVLAAFGLAPMIEAVTGGDTVGRLKPDPEMLHHTAAQLGPGPILFIGDSGVDRETARRAGVPFILHENGYRSGSVAELAPEASFAHFDHLPEVIAALLPATA